MKPDFWINMAFFQLAWPACVVGAAYGMIWPSVALVGLFAAWQLHPRNAHPNDRWLVLVFIATGLILDSVWIQNDVLQYNAAWPSEATTPLWLLMLWVALALSVNHSMRYFRQHWLRWSILLCFASPFSYWMAARLGAVEWLAPDWVVVLLLGPGWAIVVGALFALAKRMAGSNEAGRPAFYQKD